MTPENRPLIALHYPLDEIFLGINQVSADRAGTSIRIAWRLEEVALRSGWQVGSSLGTENELIAQLGVTRETLREAIRVMEARGSMEMRRGRMGGLRLLSPPIDEMAAAFAAYLQAIGCTQADMRETSAITIPVFATLSKNDPIIPLFHATLEAFFAGTALNTRRTGRAGDIAAQLTKGHEPIPDAGFFLGDEASNCEALGCTRRSLRAALRLLDDLAMLKTQRGRGGGFWLVRPSPDGTARRIFALIASRHYAHKEIVPALWALNLIRLRLAIRQMRRMDDQTRQRQCDALESLIAKLPEPKRWYCLQLEIDQIANSPILNVLAESCTVYLARLGPSYAHYSEIDESLRIAEDAFIHALRKGEYADAELMHLTIHSQISQLLNCPDLPDTPPAS